MVARSFEIADADYTLRSILFVVLASRSKIGPCLTTLKKLWFESVNEDYTIQCFPLSIPVLLALRR